MAHLINVRKYEFLNKNRDRYNRKRKSDRNVYSERMKKTMYFIFYNSQ